jgi:3-methyladenine DNA glycosylase/8-oxoguanine DNA glycosylase
VLGTAMGDPDAVAVGDFHLKNIVAFNLAGEARASDERMLELLAPYAGQRGRAVRLVQLEGRTPPKFGPRQRILPMARW